MRYLTMLFVLFVISCGEKAQDVGDSIYPSRASFVVDELSTSTSWYENIGFRLDTSMSFPDYGVEINFLRQDKFTLELIEFKDKINIPKSMLPTDYSNVHGFIKLGFLVTDLDSLVSTFSNSDSSIVSGPSELSPLESGRPWPLRYFLVSDLDGNYIQFFESNEALLNAFNLKKKTTLVPFLTMLSVKDFYKSIQWYEKLGFELIEKIERPGNQRAILSGNQFLLEIGSFKDDRSLDSLGVEAANKDRVIRMSKIGFATEKLDSLFKSHTEENFRIYRQNLEGDEPYFIIEDLEGSYIQFFGSNPI